MSLCRHAKSPFWYFSFMINGKSVFRSTKTTNKALAQKIENEARKQMVEGIHFEKKEHISLKDIIDEYMLTRQGTKSHGKDMVYSRKFLGYKLNNRTKQPIEVYGFNGSTPFHTLTTRDMFRLLNARKAEGLSLAAFNQEMIFFNGLIKLATQLGYMVPAIDVKEFKKENKLKGERQPIRYLSATEEASLLFELDPKKEMRGLPCCDNRTQEQKRQRQDTYDFVVTLLDVGARYDEIASIEWSQINLKEKTVRLFRGKVNNESTLYMTDRLYEVLLRRSKNKNSEQYVFTSKSGKARRYNPRALSSAIKRAGIENCTFHTMRKTLASKLVRNGLAISDVSTILGHSSVATTQNYYASLSPAESSKRALAILNI